MTQGWTYTGALADSLETILASSRIISEQVGVMSQLVDRVTLDDNSGESWREAAMSKLTATAVTELTKLENPQQMEDALITIKPTMVCCETFISDKVLRTISKKTVAKMGALAQNAIQRKKDEDGLTVLDGATTSLCGAGTTLTSGHISAGKNQISSNATEPGPPPYRTVLHGFQIRDIENEITAGIGTYPVGEGLTARVFSEGFSGMCGGTQVYEDGNITIDSSDDAKGGVFSQQGIVLVQGKSPWVEPLRRPNWGGGGNSLYQYDEYAYGERSVGHWLFELYSDATAPTS